MRAKLPDSGRHRVSEGRLTRGYCTLPSPAGPHTSWHSLPSPEGVWEDPVPDTVPTSWMFGQGSPGNPVSSEPLQSPRIPRQGASASDDKRFPFLYVHYHVLCGSYNKFIIPVFVISLSLCPVKTAKPGPHLAADHGRPDLSYLGGFLLLFFYKVKKFYFLRSWHRKWSQPQLRRPPREGGPYVLGRPGSRECVCMAAWLGPLAFTPCSRPRARWLEWPEAQARAFTETLGRGINN